MWLIIVVESAYSIIHIPILGTNPWYKALNSRKGALTQGPELFEAYVQLGASQNSKVFMYISVCRMLQGHAYSPQGYETLTIRLRYLI